MMRLFQDISVPLMIAGLLAVDSVGAFTINSPLPTSVTATTFHKTKEHVLTSCFASVEDEVDATVDRDARIAECQSLLTKAADTKQEDSQQVIQALLDLEKLMRQKAKAEGTIVGEEMLQQLNGDWRLIFTTGTAKTQEQYGNINYFPLKATQTFRTQQEPMAITNGIFLGDFPLIKFFGEMDFDTTKRKLEFDFNELLILNFFKLQLGQGEAAKLGAKSGLGSESNVENAKRGRQAFFNWISANADIATARGGGGGLALWKRVEMAEE